MDETTEKVLPNENEEANSKVPESPKPLAFTIDFGEGKTVDTQRFKNLFEKYQSRHKRGQSLSKFEESTSSPQVKKHPSTGKLPRKSSFNSEGYFSSDEKDKLKYQGARSTVLNTVISKRDLTLPLSNVTSDRMTQSFPNRNFDLPSINSPEIELKDVSSPELDLVSPISPLTITNDSSNSQSSVKLKLASTSLVSNANRLKKLTKQNSSPEVDSKSIVTNATTSDSQFMDALDYDFEKGDDTVSDAGTYTLDGDNYTEEQKARMSIDKFFNIEQVSVIEKTQEYIQSLSINSEQTTEKQLSTSTSKTTRKFAQNVTSPTLSTSIQMTAQKINTDEPKITKKVFNKILYPTKKSQSISSSNQEESDHSDQGVFTSITASGVLSKRPEKRGHVRRSSLVQSEIFVEAYTGDTTIKQPYENVKVIQTVSNSMKIESNDVQFRNKAQRDLSAKQKRRSLNLDEMHKSDIDSDSGLKRVTNLPPSIGGVSGKNSPTKIPSPVHTINRPRSRNSLSSQNLDFSDSSLETESYLKPTQNIISSLQARLSLDSDQDSDYEHRNYAIALNNETATKNLIKNKPMHVRHNSFDDRNVKISNKLEHFHQKNLQGIDQTYKSCNQYTQNKQVHRIQNSPNNSPIRRSSSFSLKNQFDQPKCLNIQTKDTNLGFNSPNFHQRNGSSTVQRSASTANIKPNIEFRRSSISSDQKINKPQFLDTEESSTDEDFDRSVVKNKKDLTTTRYNRAFSLRRARLDAEPAPKCPNTPEMKRKFGANEKTERTVSVDRKSGKAPDVQSRYMNITKSAKNVPAKSEPPKVTTKVMPKQPPNKPPVFSRTDTGRFSMRTPKPNSAPIRPAKKDQQGKKSGPRSNSTLSSREVEFQNWKRRKSYDPMKAAAEGKRKAELARKQNQNIMTQSYNESQDCDSSPSHSSSVHRSQSFHGTAALEQLVSSEEEEDLTLSGDEGFSPPTPSPCEMSPNKSNLRHMWMDRFSSKR